MMMRNNISYSRHPYLGQVQGHLARMSVETQEPLTSHQSFNNHGNGGINQSQAPPQPFSQSDYFLHSQQQTFPGSQSGFNFYGSYRLQSGEYFNKDANENSNVKGHSESNTASDGNKTINGESFPSFEHSKSTTNLPDYSDSSSTVSKPDSSHNNKSTKENDTIDINESNPSPLSNASLSDSEVPDNGVINSHQQVENNHKNSQENNHQLDENSEPSSSSSDKTSDKNSDNPPTKSLPSQNNYYKDYLQKYANNFLQEKNNGSKKDDIEKEVDNVKDDRVAESISPDSCKENYQPESNSEESPKRIKDPVEIAKLEEAVKKNLDEAIRQHHSRLTHPLSETSPKSTANDITSTTPTTPSQQTSPYSSQPDNRSLSPRGPPPSHVRHLNFANLSPLSPSATQPLSASSTPGGSLPLDYPPPDFPKDPRLSIGIPPPFVHQLPPSPVVFPNDLIQRSRVNTGPPPESSTPRELKRSRSDSFSSLPEHQLSFSGAAGAGKRRLDGKDYYYCHLCSYVGNSEFHFNAHMNTHFEHQCPHCDYKSRTEGRLKRHIKDFHTEDQPEDFTGGRMIRNNKPKIFRCRQCEFAATDKEEYWKHARSHIKDDKCLQCPKCPFVTEYKHHLEYHLRNHFGSKPFKCNKCNYSCVNKSMLNSHMKSHTNVYQYRCRDCTYATKYCHSLKLHLSKYNHQPATVLNNDGSLPVDGSGDFDLVSKRGPPRGPRLMKPDGMGPPSGMEGLERNLLTMHSNMAAAAAANSNPLSGMAAMMGAFWSNGLGHHPPPPLIPVSGLAPLSIQLPGQERQLMPQRHSPSGPGRNFPEFTPNCKFCTFSSENPHILADHVMKNHGSEHNEIFKMFGFKPDFGNHGENKDDSLVHIKLEQEMRMKMREQMKTPPARDGHNDNNVGYQKEMNDFDIMRAKYMKESGKSSDDSGKSSPRTPDGINGHMDFYDDRSNSYSPGASPEDYNPLNNKMDPRSLARSLADEIEREAMRKRSGREIPLDLTNTKQFGQDKELTAENELSPGGFKRSWDQSNCDEEPKSNASGCSEENEDVRNVSPNNNRKRSRKGKAYKLDMISIKLQEQYTDQADEMEGPEIVEIDDPEKPNPEEIDIKAIKEETDHLDHNIHKMQRSCNDDGVDYSDITRQLRELNGEVISPHVSPNASAADGSISNKETVDSVSVFSGIMDRKKMFINQIMSHSARENGEDIPNRDHYHHTHMQGHNSSTHRARYHNNENNKSHPDLTSPRSQEVVDEEENSGDSNDWSKYECTHCGIAFRDCIMYTMHMGYHGFQNPFTCNRCGQTTKDKVEFFLHIARKAHS